MYKTALAAAAAITTLMATSASAAPLMTAPAGTGYSNVDQVRLICNEDGRCWRSRGDRYVRRYGDDSVVVRRSYDYDRPHYRQYDEGPSVGFSFGTGRW